MPAILAHRIRGAAAGDQCGRLHAALDSGRYRSRRLQTVEIITDKQLNSGYMPHMRLIALVALSVQSHEDDLCASYLAGKTRVALERHFIS
jgi:hypothetical protein